MAVIIDGKELTFKCKECLHIFKHVIGYGPMAPSPWLRREQMRKNPPRCPHCSSPDVKRLSFGDLLFEKLYRSRLIR